MSLNPRQTRVIDPINTEVVRGFKQAMFIAMYLFPAVSVRQYGGTIIEFGKESFRKVVTRRARGGATGRVRFGYDGSPFALTHHSLEGQVAYEDMVDASVVPGIDLSRGATNLAMRIVALQHESQAADLATDAARYDANHKLALVGADKWSDPASDPVANIKAGKAAVRRSTGVDPNVLVLSPGAYDALTEHPKLQERIKYTSRESINEQILAQLLDIERVVVGRAIYAPGDEDADFVDVWGNSAVLAYVPAGGDGSYSPGGDGQILSREEPAYGYTYVLEGMPVVEQPYQDRNTKSWIYPVTYDATAVVSGISAGFLFQNPA